MPSKIQVDQIAGATGSTVTLPSGQTLDLSSGTVNLPSASLSALNATNLTSGTVPSARLSLTSSDLPTVPTTKGGTGLTTIGTASQVLRVNSGATALEFGTVSAGISNVYQVAYTGTTSFSGSGRTTGDVVSGLSATYARNSQTSKTLLNYSVNVGSTDDTWIALKIQFSTDGTTFNDVPDVADSFTSNTSIVRCHFGHSLRGGGSNGTAYESVTIPFQYLHNTSAIAFSTIYYRLFCFKGHSSTGGTTIFFNRSDNMGSAPDSNRNAYTSTLIIKEVA
jgi:hypothetical protein